MLIYGSNFWKLEIKPGASQLGYLCIQILKLLSWHIILQCQRGMLELHKEKLEMRICSSANSSLSLSIKNGFVKSQEFFSEKRPQFHSNQNNLKKLRSEGKSLVISARMVGNQRNIAIRDFYHDVHVVVFFTIKILLTACKLLVIM